MIELITLFNPDKSLLLSTTTALEFSATPSAEVLFNLFNSSAVDLQEHHLVQDHQ